MADDPLIPSLIENIEVSDTEFPQSPMPPLSMERPIRTDVILEDDEVLAERPEDEMSIPQDIEIEIEPDVDEDGNTIISFGEELPESTSDDFYGNLAEEMDQRDLSSLASDILAMYSEDRESRSDWERTYSEGLGVP